MDGFNAKRIADPVHGTIGLSDLELRVINTRAFQRLRNIKQLGLAYLVFPAADYSRFSHSVGVCHITGQILENLRSSGTAGEIDDREVQLYRLAGLLHDVGHYPFSHAMEEAIANYHSKKLLENQYKRPFKHEAVSKQILISDPQLNSLLRSSGYDVKEIYAIFNRERPPRFANLVSSDMDADRIDYMLRTAHHTGLPYGSVDIAYLLSQMRVDCDSRICLTGKAIRTAEHFLLCRYFDYQQVTFHKTVASLEWVLKDILAILLEAEDLQGSADWVTGAISDGTWMTFDDAFVIGRIRSLAARTQDRIEKLLTGAVLDRKPPKLLAEVEYVAKNDGPTAQTFRLQKRLIGDQIGKWSVRYGIDRRLFHIWDPPSMTLTKIGSHVPISSVMESGEGGLSENEVDKYEQSIRIHNKDNNTSSPIAGKRSSLISVLAGYALYSLRIYVILPEDFVSNFEEMRRSIRADLAEIDWK
jgi:HD superfamily phosphohydrolase